MWGASQSSSAHQTLLPLFSTMCPKFQRCWAAHIFRTHGAPSHPPYFYIRCCFCTACLFLLIFQFTMYKPAQTSPSLWHPSWSLPTVCLQPWIIRRSLMVTSFVLSTNYSCSWNKTDQYPCPWEADILVVGEEINIRNRQIIRNVISW